MTQNAECLIDQAPDGVTPIPIFAVTKGTLPACLDQIGEPGRTWAEAQGFAAKALSVCPVPGVNGAVSAVLFGIEGPLDDLAFGQLSSSLRPGCYRLAAGVDDAELAALGWCLGAYTFGTYKSATHKAVQLVTPDGVDAEAVRRIASAVYLTRDMINTPANDMGPADISKVMHELAATHGAQIADIVGDDLIKQDFPMIHAVGRAADWAVGRAPRLIDMTWGDPEAPRVTLVGKGVVFDTGGLDIKPSSAMLLMKKDMGGAANVIGLASMIMVSGLNVRLRVLVPTVENAISGNSFRPGDILPSRKGITVEIGNTDAEGRLILADALVLADEDKPDLIIDMATLTGAARVALGPDITPFYTDDEAFAEQLESHAAACQDPVWRMPLRRGYRAMLNSRVADINHVGGGGFAGSITAALFLKEFVETAKTWVHFDVYGWTPKSRPGSPEGGEAHAIRALYRLLTERYGG